jgi:hypothetical protein
MSPGPATLLRMNDDDPLRTAIRTFTVMLVVGLLGWAAVLIF